MMHARLRKIRVLRRMRRVFRRGYLLKNERGIQLAEVAIVLPVFLLLFAATAEFGRYFYEYTTLAKASRVGTRYLITKPENGVDDAIAKNLVVYGNPTGTGTPLLTGLTTGHVVVTRGGGVPMVPETITIQIVGFKHQPIFDLGKLLKSPGLSTNVDVKPSVTMRNLLYQPVV